MSSRPVQFKKIDPESWVPNAKNNESYVYLFGVGDRTKIGFSSNPLKRVSAVAAAIGFDIDEIYVSDPHERGCDTEKSMHKYFSEFRMKGEWFSISPEEISKRSGGVSYCEKFIPKKSLYKYAYSAEKRKFNPIFDLGGWLNNIQIRSVIRDKIKEKYGTYGEAANAVGISRQYMSRVLSNNKLDIPDAILGIVGYREVKEFSYEFK